MGNAAQVEAELRAYGEKKWLEVVDSIGTMEDGMIKPQIQKRTPVLTGLLQSHVDCDHAITGQWSFIIRTKEDVALYPERPSRDTGMVANFQEKGTRHNRARWMFRDGSEAAYYDIRGLLSSIW